MYMYTWLCGWRRTRLDCLARRRAGAGPVAERSWLLAALPSTCFYYMEKRQNNKNSILCCITVAWMPFKANRYRNKIISYILYTVATGKRIGQLLDTTLSHCQQDRPQPLLGFPVSLYTIQYTQCEGL